jgi:hypothetical protein
MPSCYWTDRFSAFPKRPESIVQRVIVIQWKQPEACHWNGMLEWQLSTKSNHRACFLQCRISPASLRAGPAKAGPLFETVDPRRPAQRNFQPAQFQERKHGKSVKLSARNPTSHRRDSAASSARAIAPSPHCDRLRWCRPSGRSPRSSGRSRRTSRWRRPSGRYWYRESGPARIRHPPARSRAERVLQEVGHRAVPAVVGLFL